MDHAGGGEPAAFFTEDPEGILGVHDESDPFYAQGKVATLVAPKVVLSGEPSYPSLKLSAKSAWPQQEAVTATARITAQVEPVEHRDRITPDLALVVTGLTFNADYTPIGTGSFSPIAPDSGGSPQWTYTAFEEPKEQKHPKTKFAWIECQWLGVPAGAPLRAQVAPVFDWLVASTGDTGGTHRHGPDGGEHAVTEEDLLAAYQFVRWKYSFLNEITHQGFRTGFSSVSVTLEERISCGHIPDAVACTDTLSKAVRFGSDAFDNENSCASTIGHELIHTAFIFTGECPAYSWEVSHASMTGINADYLLEAEANRDAACE